MKEKLWSIDFQNRHKNSPQAFSRRRKLSFPMLFLTIFRKSLKSLQLCLNEWLLDWEENGTLSKSAYSQARQKLKHTAFKELSDDLTKQYYHLEGYRRWKGYRLCGVDGSNLLLPKSEELIEKYGVSSLPATHHHEQAVLPNGRLTVCYDILNQLALNAYLGPSHGYEVELAKKHAAVLTGKDLVLFDRHYASYEFIAWLTHQKINFVIRCPRSTFWEGMELLQSKCWDAKVTLVAPGGKIKLIKKPGLCREVQVRFVKVELSSGETELLVTSLFHPDLGAEDFRSLYGLRWGIETYFSRLKVRLNLENFTARNEEGVLQDLYATLLLTNLESILTEEIDAAWEKQQSAHGYQKRVNKAVSFHAIKHQAFELFYQADLDIDNLLDKLIHLFKQNPTFIRPCRQEPRNQSGPYRRLRYLKTMRKICF